MRNHGIDLLKIYAMFLIVALHYSNFGFKIGTIPVTSDKFILVWSIFIFCFCCVNCYAIVTGYFYKNNKGNFNKFIKLWVSVVFWLLLLGGIDYFQGNIRKAELLKCLFPLIYDKYWYFTAYSFLFFLAPFYNKLIDSFSRKEFKSFLIVLLLFLSVINVPYHSLQIGNATNVIWISTMYFIGAYIKKYEPLKEFKSFNLFKLLIFLLSFGLFSVLLFSNIDTKKLIIRNTFLIDNNSSIIMVIISIIYLELFKRIKITNKYLIGLIKNVSNATFGIYIIHMSNYIKSNYVVGKVRYLIHRPSLLFYPKFLYYALACFITCLILELIRIKLFKILRVNELIDKILKKINKCDKISNV